MIFDVCNMFFFSVFSLFNWRGSCYRRGIWFSSQSWDSRRPSFFFMLAHVGGREEKFLVHVAERRREGKRKRGLSSYQSLVSRVASSFLFEKVRVFLLTRHLVTVLLFFSSTLPTPPSISQQYGGCLPVQRTCQLLPPDKIFLHPVLEMEMASI